MRKAALVAATEFGSAVRKKSFVIGILLLPTMMVGSILIQIFANKADTRPRPFAVLDRTGRLYPVIAEAAEARNAHLNDAKGKQAAPRFEPQAAAESGRSADELRLELSDRVRDGDLYA